MGQVVKLCNQVIYAAQMTATAKATAMAVRSGVDLEKLLLVLITDTGRVELLRDADRRAAWMLLVDGIPQSHVDLDDPGRAAAGRAVDVHVSQLRAKLPDPALIRTVRGVGYVLDDPDPGAVQSGGG